VTSDEKDRDYIQSLERGFAVLLAFNADRPSPTLAELASATQLSRPAVRRIMLTLQRLGYVDNAGGCWSLTPRVLSIGQHYSESHALIEVAQPHLLHLAEQTQESASLAARDHTDVVYIARVPVRRIMSINVSVGTRVAIHATSMGRVLMAWAPDRLVAEVIEATGLRAYTPRTITDPALFRVALRTVRAQGWSIVDEELEIGLLSASAPVRDHTGAVVAALASSTSSGRSNVEHLRDEVVPLLVHTAEQISADLGHRAAAGTGTAIVQGRDGFS